MPRLAIVNQELVHYNEVLNGTAQHITNDQGVTLKKNKIQVADNSIYSIGNKKLVDETEEINEYTCECGNPELVGRIYEGTVCPLCGTTVKEVFGGDIDKFGWIDIGAYKVMVPIGYKKVKAIVGKNFDKIIDFNKNIDLEGRLVYDYDKKNPYNGIGMIEFYNKFDEIMMYFGKKKDKMRDAEFLVRNKNRIFTSKIPVLSQQLRPAFVNSGEKTFRYDPINQPYSIIVNTSVLIQNAMITNRIIDINQYLFTIQCQLASLYEHIVSKLNGKKKLLRDKIQGTRCSWSSRMVIIANTGVNYGLDHIIISYKAFLELFYLEIINCLKRGYITDRFVHATIFEITNYLELLKYSNKCDPVIVELMRFMIANHEDGLWCLLNRQPTMDLGSIQCVKIVDIIENTNENIMQIPLTSLSSLNGDFDGDTLSLYSIKELCQAEEFIHGFNPNILCLDRTSSTRLYNDKFGLMKDLCVFLFDFLDNE